MIRHADYGELLGAMALLLGWLMVETTCKDEVKILEHIKNAGNLNLTFISKRRGVIIEEMEKIIPSSNIRSCTETDFQLYLLYNL
jgi:hypothetical protein